MPKLLRIDSSARHEGSRSRQLGDEIQAGWLARHPGGAVYRRDLASGPIPQITELTLIPAFRAAFPRLALELLLTDANLDLVEDRIDLAVRLAPGYGPGVIGAKLLDTRYRVVASPDHLARTGPIIAPAHLSERDCVLFTMPDYRSRWRFRRDDRLEDIPVRGSVIISSALAVRAALLDGVGPGLIGDFLIGADLASGRLVDLFPGYDVTATTFDTAAWLLYPSRDYLPTKVRATIDFLRVSLVRSP